MGNIIYKYRRLLTEGYNFTNVDEVMSALEANQIGVKIDPSYKQLNGNTKSFTRRSLQKFFNKCESLGIKDTTYGVQLLLSKTNDINLEQAVNNDGLYEFLKSYRKPWVKQLDEYNEFINQKYNSELWHKLEKAIQDEQSQKENRGKTLTKQQLENTVGKDMAHRLTHLDNEKPGTRFPVHVMKSINQATHRPDLYEEINYFDY